MHCLTLPSGIILNNGTLGERARSGAARTASGTQGERRSTRLPQANAQSRGQDQEGRPQGRAPPRRQAKRRLPQRGGPERRRGTLRERGAHGTHQSRRCPPGRRRSHQCSGQRGAATRSRLPRRRHHAQRPEVRGLAQELRSGAGLSSPLSSRARRSLPLRRHSTPSARRRSATWRLRRGSPGR
jgi:hypothetical protein